MPLRISDPDYQDVQILGAGVKGHTHMHGGEPREMAICIHARIYVAKVE